MIVERMPEYGASAPIVQSGNPIIPRAAIRTSRFATLAIA
jgi:hypothetical protein